MTMLPPLLGLVVACLVATTGIGGGLLLSPLLIVVLQVPPMSAVGTALLFMSLTKVFAALFHWRQGTVDLPLASYLLLGSIPGAVAGSGALFILQARMGHETNDILQKGIGICLIVLALISLVLDSLRNRNWFLQRHTFQLKNAIGIGFAGGFLVSATSVGSGSLIILLLLLFSKRAATILVGTDIFHGMVLTLVAALLHFRLGGIDWHLLGPLLTGAIPGVIIGTYLSILIRPFVLRRALLVFGALGGLLMTL